MIRSRLVFGNHLTFSEEFDRFQKKVDDSTARDFTAAATTMGTVLLVYFPLYTIPMEQFRC